MIVASDLKDRVDLSQWYVGSNAIEQQTKSFP
jgi:hypothetical protein